MWASRYRPPHCVDWPLAISETSLASPPRLPFPAREPRACSPLVTATAQMVAATARHRLLGLATATVTARPPRLHLFLSLSLSLSLSHPVWSLSISLCRHPPWPALVIARSTGRQSPTPAGPTGGRPSRGQFAQATASRPPVPPRGRVTIGLPGRRRRFSPQSVSAARSVASGQFKR
ncbi:hypothetical protein NL676_037292 [Syzygium grande]|nr:hypothetical protein NL676_037292 [Syzygium grande]